MIKIKKNGVAKLILAYFEPSRLRGEKKYKK